MLFTESASNHDQEPADADASVRRTEAQHPVRAARDDDSREPLNQVALDWQHLKRLVMALQEGDPKRWARGQIAETAGASGSQISNIMNGRTENPGVLLVAKLAYLLGVDLNDLISGLPARDDPQVNDRNQEGRDFPLWLTADPETLEALHGLETPSAMGMVRRGLRLVVMTAVDDETRFREDPLFVREDSPANGDLDSRRLSR